MPLRSPVPSRTKAFTLSTDRPKRLPTLNNSASCENLARRRVTSQPLSAACAPWNARLPSVEASTGKGTKLACDADCRVLKVDMYTNRRPRRARIDMPVTRLLRGVAFCTGLIIVAALSACAQRGDSLRLYVLDGGTLTIGDPTVFGLTREDVPDLTNMPVPAFLVVHPKGALLWDTGLGDQLIGRPASERQRRTMLQLVTTSLKGQLVAIGYPPEKITYLGLSHMHFDHVG